MRPFACQLRCMSRHASSQKFKVGELVTEEGVVRVLRSVGRHHAQRPSLSENSTEALVRRSVLLVKPV